MTKTYITKKPTRNEDGTYTFIISDESVDEVGDIVVQDGLEKSYYENIPVLFNHDENVVIGSISEIKQENDKTY